MRIGLNLLYAMPEIGGSWNYIDSLLEGLAQVARHHEFVAFVTPESEKLVPLNPAFTIVRCAVDPTSRVRRIWFENTTLQLMVSKYQLDCMHWFANTQGVLNRVPSLVTIYDIHVFVGYSKESQLKQFVLRQLMRMTVRCAPMMLPMSQATADDLERHLHADSRRMTVIRVILDNSFHPATNEEVEGLRLKYSLPERFWLYVAHCKPHKNHAGLLHAYHDMKERGQRPWPLVLRGDELETSVAITSQLKEAGLETDVIFLPRLARSELPTLYSAATALVYPSLYEGGGIPVVEAISCGCPVVASRLPPIQEYVGDAAYYVDPNNIDKLADAMILFENTADMREQYREAGLSRADEFSAQRVVPTLLNAYKRVALRR